MTIERPGIAPVSRAWLLVPRVLLADVGEVKAARGRHRDAMMRLGAALLQVRAQVPAGSYLKIVDECGLNRKTAQRAVRGLLELAEAEGARAVSPWISGERLGWCLGSDERRVMSDETGGCDRVSHGGGPSDERRVTSDETGGCDRVSHGEGPRGEGRGVSEGKEAGCDRVSHGEGPSDERRVTSDETGGCDRVSHGDEARTEGERGCDTLSHQDEQQKPTPCPLPLGGGEEAGGCDRVSHRGDEEKTEPCPQPLPSGKGSRPEGCDTLSHRIKRHLDGRRAKVTVASGAGRKVAAGGGVRGGGGGGDVPGQMSLAECYLAAERLRAVAERVAAGSVSPRVIAALLALLDRVDGADGAEEKKDLTDIARVG